MGNCLAPSQVQGQLNDDDDDSKPSPFAKEQAQEQQTGKRKTDAQLIGRPRGGDLEGGEEHQQGDPVKISAQIFTYRDLARATNNFQASNLLGEGGFGRVYKGRLEKTGQIVAVKRLDSPQGLQGNHEFRVEVAMLSLLHHPNLVQLIGYCADKEQRLLVYEYMPLGCLEAHLHDLPADKKVLDWNTRMKVAMGAARGLQFLHERANPPVIYRDFKSSNILLDYNYYPKLSDFGLAKTGPVGDKTHVSTRVMGTYGYCAPEYAMTGHLTEKSDVYSFGVVLLELISGRKVVDNTRPQGEVSLTGWAKPRFKNRGKWPSMVDPQLSSNCSIKALTQALTVVAMCLHEDQHMRPSMGDVVRALTHVLHTSKSADKERLAELRPKLPADKPQAEASANGGNPTGNEQEEEGGERPNRDARRAAAPGKWRERADAETWRQRAYSRSRSMPANAPPPANITTGSNLRPTQSGRDTWQKDSGPASPSNLSHALPTPLEPSKLSVPEARSARTYKIPSSPGPSPSGRAAPSGLQSAPLEGNGPVGGIAGGPAPLPTPEAVGLRTARLTRSRTSKQEQENAGSMSPMKGGDGFKKKDVWEVNREHLYSWSRKGEAEGRSPMRQSADKMALPFTARASAKA